MSVLVLAINDPTFSGQSRASEVAYLRRVLETAAMEIGRGNGTVTSGSIIGVSQAGVPNTSLGSWTYTPSATKP